jgi:glycosyltransferase involved in cell wall biosynthesis
MITNKKILISVPDLSLPGGVTGLFNLLKLNDYKNIIYFSVNFNSKKWSVLFLPFVYLKFIFKVKTFDVVHLNPSLDVKSFYRDLVFCFLSKVIFKKKTIVYWHGWQSDFFDNLYNSKIKTKIFQISFGKSDCQIVLANKFLYDLKKIGYNGQIFLESNVTEKVDLPEFDNENIRFKNQWNLLYLSRITKGKGWEIAIKTIEILNDLGYDNIKLIIAGDGDCLKEAKELVTKNKINNILFKGYVNGKTKCDLLKKSHILFFPTCYPEGMPITILEGMMYGLPIISRKEGGIPDHIIDKDNGFITDSIDPVFFSEKIIELISNQNLYLNIRKNNILKAQENFVPERLIKMLFKIYYE